MRNKTNIFSTTDLMNIGQQSYFYKVNELTPEDIEFVRSMLLHDVSDYVDSAYSRIFSLFSKVEQLSQMETDIGNIDLETLKKNYANNLEEELQSSIESQGNIYLGRLLSGDKDFFEEEIGAAHFINYICMQYMRTKKQQDNLINHISGPDKNQIVKCANLIRIVFSTKLASNIYINRNKYKLVLVENKSEIPLITCDQPVINFLAQNILVGEQVEQFGLYYPLSPKRALFLVEKEVFGSATYMGFDEKSVTEFNHFMVRNSHEQVYSISEEQLRSFVV